ncbi:hypothetical protein D3C72_2151830 [compost metagenome]
MDQIFIVEFKPQAAFHLTLCGKLFSNSFLSFEIFSFDQCGIEYIILIFIPELHIRRHRDRTVMDDLTIAEAYNVEMVRDRDRDQCFLRR